MTILWLAVLLIYGLATSFSEIPALAWLLLIPFFAQGVYDANYKDKRR